MPPFGKADSNNIAVLPPCYYGGNMKKLIPLLLAILLLLTLTACSEKDKDPTAVHVWAYSLDQFVPKALVADSLDATVADSIEFRNLYNYEIVSGADGFSPRQSSNAGYDLNWNTFKQGYFVPTNGNRTWFEDLPGAFKVSDTGYFRMYRKIDVDAAGATKSVELKGLSIYPITNWDGATEDAVKLSDLLQGIAAYDSVQIVCYDGYGNTKYYHADAINDGYYLLNSERTIFPTASIPNNMKKMKKVAYINVIGATSAQTFDFELAPQDAANMIFAVPASLSGLAPTDIADLIE
jgi:hypothetical protein